MRKTFSQLNKVRMKIKIYDVLVGNYVKDDWYATIFERSLKIYFEYITLRWSPESFSHSFLLICLRERSDCNNILCLLFTHFLQNLHSHWVSPLKHIQFLLFFSVKEGLQQLQCSLLQSNCWKESSPHLAWDCQRPRSLITSSCSQLGTCLQTAIHCSSFPATLKSLKNTHIPVHCQGRVYPVTPHFPTLCSPAGFSGTPCLWLTRWMRHWEQTMARERQPLTPFTFLPLFSSSSRLPPI